MLKQWATNHACTLAPIFDIKVTCLDPNLQETSKKRSAPQELCSWEMPVGVKDMKSITTNWHFCLIASYYNHPPSLPITFTQSISNRLFKQTLEGTILVAWREILVANQSTSFPAFFFFHFHLPYPINPLPVPTPNPPSQILFGGKFLSDL